MTDPIADMLTRIRNALAKRHEVVEIPFSNMKKHIVEILKGEGFIKDFHVADYKGQGKLLVHLKYTGKRKPAIIGLKRISKPGRRQYLGYQDLKPVLNGNGVAILSTSKGIVTDRMAREQKLGGELLASIW